MIDVITPATLSRMHLRRHVGTASLSHGHDDLPNVIYCHSLETTNVFVSIIDGEYAGQIIPDLSNFCQEKACDLICELLVGLPRGHQINLGSSRNAIDE